MTVHPGENVQIQLAIKTDLGVDIPLSQLSLISVAIICGGTVRHTYIWKGGVYSSLPPSCSASSILHEMIASDGLVKIELIPAVSAKLKGGAVEIEVTVTYIDASYIATGGQTDITCIEDAFDMAAC
jgi:hypothetical protein